MWRLRSWDQDIVAHKQFFGSFDAAARFLVCCKIPNLFYLISALLSLVSRLAAFCSLFAAFGDPAAYFPLCKIYAINGPAPPPPFESRVTCRTQLGAFVVIVIVVNVAQRQYRICIFLCQHRRAYIYMYVYMYVVHPGYPFTAHVSCIFT